MYELSLGSSRSSRPLRMTTIPVYDVERLVPLQLGHMLSAVR